jgi:hypothetical protein
MINLPLNESIERISKKTGLSADEVNQKIKAKLKQLSGLISEEGAAYIVANELGVKLFEPGEALQIKNIMPGMRNVDVTAKVVQKYDLREFNSERGPGKVASMLIGDDTGVMRVTMWHKQAELVNQLKEGDIVKIVGGYVRENNGRRELHLNEMSKVIINPKGVEISVKPYTPAVANRKKISEITENDSGVELLATIVQVFDINFFEVCPQCNKRARLREEGFMCPTHGKVAPDFNYVLNIYLDDGSDNMRVVLWRDQVEQLLGLGRDQVLSFKDDLSKFEPFKTELLGNIIKVQGRANKNQTFDRIELVASKIDKNPDPEAELGKLKEEGAKAAANPKPDNAGRSPGNDKLRFQPAPANMGKQVKESKEDRLGRDGSDSESMEDFDIDSELMDIEDI